MRRSIPRHHARLHITRRAGPRPTTWTHTQTAALQKHGDDKVTHARLLDVCAKRRRKSITLPRSALVLSLLVRSAPFRHGLSPFRFVRMRYTPLHSVPASPCARLPSSHFTCGSSCVFARAVPRRCYGHVTPRRATPHSHCVPCATVLSAMFQPVSCRAARLRSVPFLPASPCAVVFHLGARSATRAADALATVTACARRVPEMIPRYCAPRSREGALRL